jgi:hypothetical protein
MPQLLTTVGHNTGRLFVRSQRHFCYVAERNRVVINRVQRGGPARPRRGRGTGRAAGEDGSRTGSVTADDELQPSTHGGTGDSWHRLNRLVGEPRNVSAHLAASPLIKEIIRSSFMRLKAYSASENGRTMRGVNEPIVDGNASQRIPYPRRTIHKCLHITILLCGCSQARLSRASICRLRGSVRESTLNRLYVPPSDLRPRLTRRSQGLTIGRDVLRKVSRRWRYSCSSISPRVKRSPSTSSAAVVRKVVDRPPPVR